MIFILNRDLVVETVASNVGDNSLPFYNDKFVQYLKQASTFEFTIPENHPSSDSVIVGNYVVTTDNDGNTLMFTIMEVSETHGTLREKYCYGESVGLELLNEVDNAYTETTAHNIAWYVNKAITGTGWEIGYNDVVGISKALSFTESENVLSRILKILTEFNNAEIHFSVDFQGGTVTHKYINLYTKRGENNGKRFQYNRDIKSIKRTINGDNICTALLPEGKTDQNNVKTTINALAYDNTNIYTDVGNSYLYSRYALDRWGQAGGHIFRVFNVDTLSSSELLEKAIVELQSRENPSITYECDVVLLKEIAGYFEDEVRIGDTVKIVDNTFSPPLLLEARIVQMEYSFTNNQNSKVTLGNYTIVESDIGAELRAIQGTLREKEAVWTNKEDKIYKQPTPPTHLDGRIWIDTSKSPEIMYRSTGTEWIALSPTEASQIGGVSQTDFDSNKEISDWYATARTSGNLLTGLLDMNLSTQPYQWEIQTLPDGTQGNVIVKRHTANQTLQNVGLYFPWVVIDPRKTYLLEFYVKALDKNSKYYYGREEANADGLANDGGNGPYLISGKIATDDQIGQWVKYTGLIPPYFSGLNQSHITNQSLYTNGTEYKFWDINTAQIQVKTFLTYAPVDVAQNSEMYACNFGLYEVGTNDALYDSLTSLDSRLSSATDPTKMVETVVYSGTFESILTGKADVDDISGLATGEQVTAVQNSLTGYVNDRLDSEGGIQEQINKVTSSLEETANSINAKFTSSGGINLIKNSLGFASVFEPFWVETNTVIPTQSEELVQLGFGSGFTSTMGEGGYIEQVVNTTVGDTYTLSFFLKKTHDSATDGSAGIEIYQNGERTHFIGRDSNEGITNGYELGKVTFDTQYNQITIRVIFGLNSADSVITGLMMNVGEVGYQWSHAQGEIYNTNVSFDLTGIRVKGTSGNYSQITPNEFSGYFPVVDEITGQATMTRIFSLNGDTTETNKLSAQRSIEMSPLKIVPIESTNYTGWAIIPSD